MVKKFFIAMITLCVLCCCIITASAETKNIEMFTIFDGITFSSSLESIEKHMEGISYQKVANYGLFGKYGFFSDNTLVFGEIADTVWFDTENEKLIRIRIIYEAGSDVFKTVLNSLLDEYGISVFDYNDDNAKVYAWWSNDAQIFFGAAPMESSIEDAENGDVLSMITITPYEKQFSYDDLQRILFGE